jgi:NTE family protein
MAFHAGVLRWLAEQNLLEGIKHISSVSGGSLFIGLVLHYSDYQWPGSKHYLKHVLPKIEDSLTSKCLQTDFILRTLYSPRHWLSRANILATSIIKIWGIDSTLANLPTDLVWSINGTTAENGRRFRFKGTTAGDYEIGYANVPEMKLANVMAMSAAFPGAIGPLKFEAGRYEWLKRPQWHSPSKESAVVPYKTLCLYDGGVYDNLGIEPFFDVGQQAFKEHNDVDFLVVVDAGAAYARQNIPGPLHPKRLTRITSICTDQSRALRVRSYINFLRKNPSNGTYIQIGADPLQKIALYGNKEIDYSGYSWLPRETIKEAAGYKTTLKCMTKNNFIKICQHGYETVEWNKLLFGREWSI